VVVKLSDQQIDAVKRGEAVKLADGGIELVLLRADLYERVKALLYDDTEWTAGELRSLLAKSAEANGWNEPEMDEYDDYEEELKKRCP
jgi:hypothetical protein